MNLVLGLSVLAAVLAVAFRLIRRRVVERRRPGRTPSTAVLVEDFGDIDITIQLQACECGGRLVLLGEGSLAGDPRPLRVARVECRRCEREIQLYFDLSQVRH